MTRPRRRWSFGLRTLFVVVTVFCAAGTWVAHERNTVAQRKRLADRLEALKDLPEPTSVVLHWQKARGWRDSLFGDRRLDRISAWNSPLPDDVLLEIGRLYPEAKVREKYRGEYPDECEGGVTERKYLPEPSPAS